MQGQTPIAVFAIVLGALETAGGAQELIYQGILRSRTFPLEAGTLGTLAGILLLATGIAMLVNGRSSWVLAQAAAYVSVPTFIMIGIVNHIAGWGITALGIIVPLLLVLYLRKSPIAVRP
jgi:hypothetical protein